MLKNYFKIAIRNFTKRKVYSVINMVGMSIAITACLLVYLFVSSELSFDKFNTQYEDIYRLNIKSLRSNGQWWEGGAVAAVMAPELSLSSPEIESFARIKTGVALTKIGNEINEELFHYADPALFEIFSLPLVRGEYLSLNNDPNSVLLSEDYAHNFFNTSNIIGQVIEMELQGEFVPLTIKGIVKDIPNNSSVQFNILLPFKKFEEVADGDWLTSWRAWGVTTFLLMDKELDKSSFENSITAAAQKHFPEDQQGNISLSVQPLKDLYLNETVRGITPRGKISTSYALIAIACFILIIAVINFTNLMIGMALPRSKEVGVRKVVGASKSALLIQFIGEAFLVTLLSFLIAILLTDLFLPGFAELTGTAIDVNVPLDGIFILFSISLLVLITLLAGSYPAFVISRFKPIISLKGEKIRAGNWLVKSLVVVQFSLAVFFSLAVIIMIQQIDFFYSADKGYSDERIMTVYIRDLDGDLITERMKNGLADARYVEAVTATGWSGTRLTYNGEQYRIEQSRVDPNYLSTLDIDIISGRDFNDLLQTDQTNSIIVNRSFLEALGIDFNEAIGMQVPFNGFEDMDDPKIIGVIDDVKFESLDQAVRPRVLHLNPGLGYKRLLVKFASGRSTEAMEEINAIWREIYAVRPLEIEYLTDINRQQYAELESQKAVIAFAGGISILISCLGLFALSSLHIQQRTKEVGIRKVLGANPFSILLTLSYNFIVLLFLAIIIASPLAWYTANDWLNNFANRVEINYLHFITTAIVVFCIAYLSISYQVFKTARINPVDSLRCE